MYRDHTVGVVVPAYNESGLVGEVVDTVPDFVDRVYVIDDRSTDGTWAEIRRHAARANAEWVAGASDEPAGASDELATEDGAETGTVTTGHGESVREGPGESGQDDSDGATPDATATADGGRVFEQRVVAMRNEVNRGVGGSIKAGYRRALADGLDVVAVMNGDGQMDPAVLDDVLDPVVDGRADYAKGNRLGSRRYRESMSRWRVFGNALLTFLTKVASGYWSMMDPQNGYTAISREALETIDVDDLYEDYGFLNDLLVTLNVHGFRIADVDMPAIYGEERSHIRYSRFVPKLSWLLLRSFVWRLRSRYLDTAVHPVVLLYGLGAVGGTTGVLSGAWALVAPTDGGYFGRASLGLIVLSSTLLALSMLLDMQQNSHLALRTSANPDDASDA